MTVTTKLFNLTHEIKNREGHPVPIDNFLASIQAQLEEWILSRPDYFNENEFPLKIHLKIQGSPRINKRDFSGIIAIGVQSQHKEIIEIRLKKPGCIYCWSALLIFTSSKLANLINACARKDAFEFLEYSKNKLEINYINSSSSIHGRQARPKELQHCYETIKNMNLLSSESNLYRFCHELITLPGGNEMTAFTVDEIYTTMEKILNKKIPRKTLFMMLSSFIEIGVFNPVANTDYENPVFTGAIPLYEATEEYNDYLIKQKEIKHEQKLKTMRLNLDRVQKEVTRLENQLAQAKLNVQKAQEEIEQFELAK
jgi:hypothetical protein